MRILYVGNAQGFGNADRFYMIPQKLINGFTRLGHTVYVYNDRDFARYSNVLRSRKWGEKAANDKLLEIVKQFSPDLIVLAHCEMITNATLREVRTVRPDVRIVYRNVDPLSDEGNVEDIKNRTGFVDGIFVTTAGDTLAQFAHSDTFTTFMPNPIDPSIETGRAFQNNDLRYDLFFAGSFLRHQEDHRHAMLLQLKEDLSELNLGLFGAGLGTEKVFGAHYLELLQASKMGLCINKTSEYYLYASDRMAQYLGNGLLVFIDKGPRFGDIFTDEEMIFFDGYSDLVEKLKYYSGNDSERCQIAEKGWVKAQRIFNCETVAQYILDRSFGNQLSRHYEWPTEIY